MFEKFRIKQLLETESADGRNIIPITVRAESKADALKAAEELKAEKQIYNYGISPGLGTDTIFVFAIHRPAAEEAKGTILNEI